MSMSLLFDPMVTCEQKVLKVKEKTIPLTAGLSLMVGCRSAPGSGWVGIWSDALHWEVDSRSRYREEPSGMREEEVPSRPELCNGSIGLAGDSKWTGGVLEGGLVPATMQTRGKAWMGWEEERGG